MPRVRYSRALGLAAMTLLAAPPLAWSQPTPPVAAGPTSNSATSAVPNPAPSSDEMAKKLQETVEFHKQAAADFQQVQGYLRQVESEMVAMTPRFVALAGKEVDGGNSEGDPFSPTPLSEEAAKRPVEDALSWVRNAFAKNEATFRKLTESFADGSLPKLDNATAVRNNNSAWRVWQALTYRAAVFDELEHHLQYAIDGGPGALWLLNTREAGLQVQILRAAAGEWSTHQAAGYVPEMDALNHEYESEQKAIYAEFDRSARSDYVAARQREDASLAKLDSDYVEKFRVTCDRYDDASVRYIEGLAEQLESIIARLVMLRSRLRDDVRRHHTKDNSLARDPALGQPAPIPEFEYGKKPWEDHLIGVTTPAVGYTSYNGTIAQGTLTGASCGDLLQRGLAERVARFPSVELDSKGTYSQRVSVDLPDGDVLSGLAEGKSEDARP